MQAESSADDKDLFYKLYNEHSVKKAIGHIPFASNLSLLDVSLKARGKREDQLFANNQFLRQNVRRGLSFLEQDVKKVQICRRGLEKFFDLKSEYINMLEGTFDKSIHKLSKDEVKLYSVILEEVEKTLDEGGRVIVYKTEKANGENAQISYNAEFDAWVVASKNVSTLIRTKADIEHYVQARDQSRYAFAILIGYAWLDILEKKVADVNELKKELTGKTLVGEYCGNPKHQHLVEYKEITIYFFAMVDLYGDRTCLPMNLTKAFLQKHKLPMVKITPVRECASQGELISLLKSLSKEVAESTIEEDAEGAVLYFEAEIEGEHEILSLCKLKTLEYRLYRKLREKLKSMISRGKQVAEQMGSYKKESEKLCKGYDLPKPLSYYYEIAQLALEFVVSNMGIARSLGLSNRYIDFLNVIKSCKDKSVKPKVEHFKKILESKNALSDESDLGDEDKDHESEEPKEKGRRASEEEETKTRNEGGNSKNSRKKSRKSTQDSAEDDKQDNKRTKAKQIDDKAMKQVVIITPPLYLDKGLIQKIQEQSGVKEIRAKWPDENLTSRRQVYLVHNFPEVLTDEEIKRNTIFLLAGFNKDNMKRTLKKLESLVGLCKEELSNFNDNEVSFIKDDDKQKLLEGLWEDYDKFSKEFVQVMSGNYSEPQLAKPDKIVDEVDFAFEKLSRLQTRAGETASEKETKTEKKPKSSKKNLLVFVFLGLPGMGKTTYIVNFAKILEQNGCSVSTVSSDQVRKEIIDEFLKKNPKASFQHAFDKSSSHAKTKFFERIENVLEKVSTYPQDTHALILDKNHPPNIIEDTIQFFHKQRYLTKLNVKIALVTPQCVSTFNTNHNHYPFSLSFLLKCIRRATARANHETLVGDVRKMVLVIVGFFNLYKDFRFNEANLAAMGADLHLTLPFTEENVDQEKQIQNVLAEALDKLLHKLRGFNADEDKLTAFVDLIEKIDIEPANPNIDLVHRMSLENVEKCLKLFEEK